MICLAVFDLCYICLSLTIFGFKKFCKTYADGPWYILVPWAIPLIQISLTGSIYCTVAITLERYLVVCRPFYRISREWPPQSFIVPIVLISIVYNLPQFFEIQTCEYQIIYDRNLTHGSGVMSTYCPGNIFQDDHKSSTFKDISFAENMTKLPDDVHELYIDYTSLSKHNVYIAYKTISNFLINAAIPFALILICNAKIVRGLKLQYGSVNSGRPAVAHETGKSFQSDLQFLFF